MLRGRVEVVFKSWVGLEVDDVHAVDVIILVQTFHILWGSVTASHPCFRLNGFHYT
jgi:hypothetical protein